MTHLALYITNIVNMTLSTGIFPSKLKSAIFLPLLKKQNLDSESFKNYRPVSNLPCLSKVIEKVMACRLLEHMKDIRKPLSGYPAICLQKSTQY